MAVLDSPRGATVLALYAHGVPPLLQEARLVQDQHGFRMAQVFPDIRLQIVPHPVCVPGRPVHYPLQPIRTGMPGLLRYLPAVLPGHWGQQGGQVTADMLAHFLPVNMPADPVTQRL